MLFDGMMSLFLVYISLFLGLGSLLICILSLLIIGIAAPFGLLRIDFDEEMEELSTSIDNAAISLVTVPARASRNFYTLITSAFVASFNFVVSSLARTVHHASRSVTFALLVSFNFFVFNLTRTAHHANLSVKKTIKLLITACSWPPRCIRKSARILLSSRSSHAPKPSPTAHLEAHIEWLQSQISGSRNSITKLHEELESHRHADNEAYREALQAKRAKKRQDELVIHQLKTIETLQKDIAAFPQEYLELRDKKSALEQEVDDLEEKLDNALKALEDAEERQRENKMIADSMVTDAQEQQHLAEVERDQAESYFEKATTKFEDRLRVSASEIFKLKKEIAKRSLIDPRIFSQTVEQARTLHSERDDARDILTSVTAQLEKARTAETAGKNQLKNLRTELARVKTETESELHTAGRELAKTKAEAQKEVKAARSESERCERQSVADATKLWNAQRSLENTESQYKTEIFNMGQKHQGEMWTAQSTIRQLETITADLQARNATLDEKLMHAENLPRDPELVNRLTLATAEIQRVRDEHTAELAGVRKAYEHHLQRAFNDYVAELQSREQEHVAQLQSREQELRRESEKAFNEYLMRWRVEEEKLGQQVDHWKARADRAERNVTEVTRDAQRAAHGQEQRELELNTRLQQHEQDAVKRCQQAYEAGLAAQADDQKRLQNRVDELQSQLLSIKEELEDLRASNSEGHQPIVAEDPAASAQVPQTLPVSDLEPVGMTDEQWEEWYGTQSLAVQEEIRKQYDFDFDLGPAPDSAVPLQTSPTSPPLEPASALQEPDPEPTFALDPQLMGMSTPTQAPIPTATPQQARAPSGRPMLTPRSPLKGMVPRGPRKPKPKPNHYTQQRREEEAAYDAGLGPKLDHMFFGAPKPSTGAPVAPQSVPSGIPESSGFGKTPRVPTVLIFEC